MASASTSDVFNCSVEEFYKIITDYEKYPEFLSEVKSCKVLEEKDGRKLVEYHINVIKNFKYSIWLTENPTTQVSWDFAEGDMFKEMSGGWKLEDEAGKCRAHYSIEAKLGMWVPGPISKALIEVNLPNMISSYHKRVKEVYGK